MDRGIKKIKCVGGLVYKEKSTPGSIWVVKPDQMVSFAIAEWYPDTTPEDKKKNITWMRQSADRKTILKQLTGPASQQYSFLITRKLCGNYSFYIEASLSGKRDKAKTGLYVRGWCEPKIISSKWSKQPGGANIKNQAGIIRYGNVVNLNLQTEGLNGSSLTVEVYNRVGFNRADQITAIYTNVVVVNGELDLQIGNTYAWMGKIKNISNDEDFYVKVKDPATNKYLIDNLKQDLHAVYLKIRNEVATTQIAPTRNNKVAKVGQAQSNAKRHDPCKFEKIEIIETIKEIDAKQPTTFQVFDSKNPKVNGISYETVAPGENLKKEITLKVTGYDTTKCVPKTHKPKKGIFKEVGQKAEPSDKAVTFSLDSGTVKKSVYSDLSRFNLNPIQYIWPIATTPNQFHYYINSCAYYQQPVAPTVNVKVYPDIKWELKLDFGSDQAMEERYKNMAPGKQSKNHHKSAQKAGYNRYMLSSTGKSEVYFGFTLKAVWNNKNSEAEFGEKYLQTIRNFLGVFVKLKEWADEASHLNKAKGGNKTMAQRLIGGVKRMPLTLKFAYPTISVAASWWLEHSRSNPAVVQTQGSLKLGFTPLFKAEGILDLLFYAELIPVAGQVIKVLDIGASIAGAEALFTLTASGELSVTAEFFDFSFNKAQLDIKGKAGLKLELSVKASGKFYVIVWEADYKFEATGSAESYFEPRASIGKDANGVFVEQQIDFTGVKIVLIIKGQIKKSKTNIKRTFTLVERKEKITHGKSYFVQ
jgi:hypothetical protein